MNFISDLQKNQLSIEWMKCLVYTELYPVVYLLWRHDTYWYEKVSFVPPPHINTHKHKTHVLVDVDLFVMSCHHDIVTPIELYVTYSNIVFLHSHTYDLKSYTRASWTDR